MSSQALARRLRSGLRRGVVEPGLFEELGWGHGSVTLLRSGRWPDASIARIGRPEEPRALMISGLDPDEAAGAVALAYSGEATYTVQLHPDVLRLFETNRWVERPGDRPLVEAPGTDSASMANLLDLLRPDSGPLRELSRTERRGIPSREALSARLARALADLRRDAFDQALYRGDDAEDWDADLLRTFHMLLYVRFHEDRHGPIGTALGELRGESGLGPVLANVLGRYRGVLNSELFAGPGMDVSTLRDGALGELLKAFTEPWEQLHLDFSVTSSDVAGRLYQSYLRKRPRPESSGRLFPQAVQVDERSARGAYYTPPALARRVTARALGRFLDRSRPSQFSDVRVLDPACGSGAFLLAAYRLLNEYFSSRWGHTLSPDERGQLLIQSIFGADSDPSALLLARVQLLEEADLGARRLPKLAGNLLLGDTLLSRPGEPAVPGSVHWDAVLSATGPFSVIVTNPPFGSQLALARRVDKAQRLAVRHLYPEVHTWGVDEAYAFVVLSMALLDTNGAAGFVLPHTVLQAPGAGPLRRALEAVVAEVDDLRGLSAFHGAQSYVATIVVDKAPSSAPVDVWEVTDSRLDARDLLSGISVAGVAPWRRYSIDRGDVAKARNWAAFELRWQPRFEQAFGVDTEPLALRDRRILVQGTQTSANDALTFDSADIVFPSAETAIVRGHQLDRRRVRLLAKGSNITPWSLIGPRRFLVLPFDRPDLFRSSDDMLDLLDDLKIRPANLQPGRLDVLLGPKVLLRGLAREPAAVVDLDGAWVTVKGTGGGLALAMSGAPTWCLDAATALLNSALYQWLLRGIGRPKSDESVELPLTAVAAMPWPQLRAPEWRRLAKAGGDAAAALKADEGLERIRAFADARAHLDGLVFDLLRVSQELMEAVTRELVRVA